MRQAKVSITLDLVEVMCRQSDGPFVVITENALPADAKIVDCYVRGGHGKEPVRLDCIVESKAFADLAPLAPMPMLPAAHRDDDRG